MTQKFPCTYMYTVTKNAYIILESISYKFHVLHNLEYTELGTAIRNMSSKLYGTRYGTCLRNYTELGTAIRNMSSKLYGTRYGTCLRNKDFTFI